MTDNQAKEILKLYRPGSADAEDASFGEALALCERNPELKNWFAEHCALYSALRAKFKQIPVPEGLREQIVSERKVHAVPLWQKAVLLVGAVAVVGLVLSRIPWPQPPEPHDFAYYRAYMVGQADRQYTMDQLTNNLDQIRLFLTQKGAVTNYVLPDNLQKKALVAGCVETTFQGKAVSMICFQTRPMRPTDSDLWLIVTENSTTTENPSTTTPKIDKTMKGIKGITTASWMADGKTYVLAVKGDEQLLGTFL
jgi:hypothetical protein